MILSDAKSTKLLKNLPIKTSAFPDKVDDKIADALSRCTRIVFQLDANLLTVIIRNFYNMSESGPRLVQLAVVAESQLVTVHQLHVTVSFRKHKVRYGFLVETDVPANLDVLLRLRRLQTLVVVSLELNEGSKYVLILIAVLVTQQNLLRLLVDARFLEILKSRVDIVPPQFLELIDLLCRYLTSS